MDEGTYSVEEEFQLQECDRTEHLKHIRQLEERRNAQEQREIELERVQRQIINKLNITEKSDNEVKSSDNAKAQSADKSSSKQNGIHNASKTDVGKPFKTVQKNNDRRRMNPNKSAPSFHSDGFSSHNHNPHYKENYRRHPFHDVRQQRSYRGSRGRSSNHQRYQERYHNRPVNNSVQEFNHTGKEQVDLAKEQTEEYLEYDVPSELFPNSIQEEEEMLKEAIELSKQQMFIEKLERREIDKAVEETLGNQQTEPSDEGIKIQKHSNSRTVSKEDNDASRKSYSNLIHSISFDGKHGDNFSRQKTNYSRTNFAGNSRSVKYNKTKKLGSKGKQKDTAREDSFRSQGMKITNPIQIPEKSPDTNKPNPSNQTETMLPRTDLTTEALVQSCSNQISEYDINSSKWKECARKDLKQLLHLDNSSDSSVKTDHLEITATVIETGSVNSNTFGAEGNSRHDGVFVDEIPCQENYHAEKFSGRHRTKNCCNNNHTGNCVVPVKFSNCSQNNGSSHKMGGRVRISERRTTRVQHKGKPQDGGSNGGESICANWIPYRKFAEEGRTDSIPPRFRKQCQQLNS